MPLFGIEAVLGIPNNSENPPENKAGIALSPKTRSYYPEMAAVLARRFPDQQLRVEMGLHPNGMPIPLVGEADHVLMIQWLNGDNFQDTWVDLDLFGSAFTLDPDSAGPNTPRLGLFFPFADLREHDRTRKPTREGTEITIVKAQGVLVATLAEKVEKVAGAKYVAFVDMHNPWKSSKWFKNVDVINISTINIFADYLINERMLTPDLDTIIASVDVGDLISAYDLASKLGYRVGNGEPLDLTVFLKTRVGDNVFQKLAYGNVRGKRVIVVDDMISGGTTTKESIELLLNEGAEEIIFYATHPVFAGDYYKKLRSLLSEPKVKMIMTTNSLPLPVRQGRSLSIPKARLNGTEKKVKIMDITEWIADKAETLLQSQSGQHAKALLKDEILEPRNPYELLEEITGEKIAPPADVGVYYEGGLVMPFPQSATLFSS